MHERVCERVRSAVRAVKMWQAVVDSFRPPRELLDALSALERLGADRGGPAGLWLTASTYGLPGPPPRELVDALERGALRAQPEAHLFAASVAEDLAAAAKRLEAVTTISDARCEAASLRELAVRVRR